MEALRVGDPMDAVDRRRARWPRRDLVDDLDEQVQATVAAGARVLTGGTRSTGPGYYYAPTVLADVPRELAGVSRGAVRSGRRVCSRADDQTRPSALANDSTFGLGASVWTNDDAERERFVARDRGRHGLRQRAWSPPIRACPSAA